MTSPPPRLLLAIHDVSPRFEHEIIALHAQLATHVGAGRMAMLVVPDHWRQAPFVAGSPFARRLRDWSDIGIEMFVHGWTHRDRLRHRGWARWKAHHMTAREGEFLGLNAAEAAARMADGKALVEDIIGRPAAGFIAPAWLYGDGARVALAASGFALAEDHWSVWRPGGAVVARGPVITWASRSPARIRASLAVAAAARRLMAPLPVARIAVHPGDTRVPAIRRSIDMTIAALLRRRQVARYADLAG